MSMWLDESSVSSATFSFSDVTVVVSSKVGVSLMSCSTDRLPRTSTSAW